MTTTTGLWSAPRCLSTKSRTSLNKSWRPWWPLTSGLVSWAAVVSLLVRPRDWLPNLPQSRLLPLPAAAPNCTTCRPRHSPSASLCHSHRLSRMCPLSRRHRDVSLRLLCTRPPAPPRPPCPSHPPPRRPSLRPIAWTPLSLSRAPAQWPLNRVKGPGTKAAPRRSLSASNRNHRSWTRCTSTTVSHGFQTKHVQMWKMLSKQTLN